MSFVYIVDVSSQNKPPYQYITYLIEGDKEKFQKELKEPPCSPVDELFIEHIQSLGFKVKGIDNISYQLT